jgi:hypothetical protein
VCRLLRLVALALLAGAALAAAPASAQTLTPTNNALPGSNFQGGDGNQDDAELPDGTPGIDWQGMAAARRVRHNPDPNEQDSAFAGGNAGKEDNPGQWDLTTEAGGVNPPKDNILDAWSVVDQPNGNTFLYLGFAREASGGDTYLAFELNRDARLWNNGQANIPCRRTGDVLVSYQPQGNVVRVVLQRWVTDPGGTDNASGCARTGRLENFAALSNEDAQGAVNSGTITNYLRGAGDTIEAERFGEASLNLAALLEAAFGDDCLAFSSIWMHSRSSTAEESNMQDYVAPRRLNVRTCAASGVKFFDSNANGIRDPGERGIPRFLIWADYDDDGVLDPDPDGEPFSISDNRGRYVIYNIRPPDGDYTLRETPARTGRFAPVGLDWICSHPIDGTPPDGTGSTEEDPLSCRWGPINVDAEPNARGRNFGDWFPARLTLRKQLEPASDPGRFNLLVNGNPWFREAGDGAIVSRPVPPGTYAVSEEAVPPTDPAGYRSLVDCRRANNRRGGRNAGVEFPPFELRAGQRAVCTFRNILLGSPAIAIRKVGPDNATAGDTLRYRFYVENIGDVPFAAVTVTDPACDEPPVLDSKGDDASPSTLDPGDVWIYRCSNQTESPGDDCEPTRVDNMGTVIGTTTDGTTVDDDDSISVILFCPDVPPPPPPEPVTPTEPGQPGQPGQPGPVAPPGPTPPRAGDAAVARALFRRAVGGCISGRAPHVRFSGTRIARVRVFINGRLDPRLTIRALERRLTPRVRRGPGRYRIAVRVTFERGSGTPPLTLRGSFRICARPSQAPRVTG